MEKKPKVLLLGLLYSRLCPILFPSLGVNSKLLGPRKKQGVPPTLVPIEKSSSVSYFFGHDVVDSLVEKLSGGVYFSLEKRRKTLECDDELDDVSDTCLQDKTG